MRTNLLSLKFADMSYAKFLAVAQQIATGMNASLTYPSPSPDMLTINNLITLYSDALTARGNVHNHGSTAQLTTLRNARTALQNALTALSEYVCNTTPGDLESFQLAGWPTRAANQPTGLLEAIQNFRQLFKRSIVQGTLELKWSKPANAVNSRVPFYRVMRGATADFNAAIQIATTTKTSFVDTNPGSGFQFYWIIPCNAYGDGVVSSVIAGRANQVSPPLI